MFPGIPSVLRKPGLLGTVLGVQHWKERNRAPLNSVRQTYWTSNAILSNKNEIQAKVRCIGRTSGISQSHRGRPEDQDQKMSKKKEDQAPEPLLTKLEPRTPQWQLPSSQYPARSTLGAAVPAASVKWPSLFTLTNRNLSSVLPQCEVQGARIWLAEPLSHIYTAAAWRAAPCHL